MSSPCVIIEVFSYPIYGLCLKPVLHQRWGHLWDRNSNFFPLRKTENFINFTSQLFFLWTSCSDSRVLNLWQSTGMGIKCIIIPLHYQIYHRVIYTWLGLQRLRSKKKEKSPLMARLTLFWETMRLALHSLKKLCVFLKCAFQASKFLKKHFQKYHNFNKEIHD